MRGRNGTCAWLPHSEHRTAKYSRVGAAALVAARAAEVGGGVAGVARGAPAGAAAHAALRLGREALLGVVLLIVGGVDELGAAVDAGEGSIGVGHEEPPERVDSSSWCARKTGPVGNAEAAVARRRATLGAVLESRGRGAPGECRRRIHRFPNASVSRSKSCQLTCHNDRRPFAQASGEQLGAPRSPGSCRRRGARGGRYTGHASTAPHRRRPPRCAACRPRRPGRHPARAAVRRIRRHDRPGPRRRRSTSSSSRATCSTRTSSRAARSSARRRSSSASSTRGSGSSSRRARTTSTTGRRSTARMTSPALVGSGRLGPGHRARPGPPRGPPQAARPGRARPVLRDEARAARRRCAGLDVAQGRPRGVARRPAPRRPRDRGQDGRRRRRDQHRRDRGEPPRLPRARPLALDHEGQGRPHDLRVLGCAGADRARPGPGGQRAARVARRADGKKKVDDRGAQGRQDARSSGCSSTRRRSARSRRSSPSWPSRPTRTSCSTWS